MNRSTIKIVLPFLVLLLMAFFTVGCLGTENNDADNNTNINKTANDNAAKEKATLYFGDKEAMYLIAEERELAVEAGQSLEASVLEALIAGPESPELSKTIPDETKFLSVRVEEGTAYVDFSKDFQTNHWGGSAGELMTIYSVTNSLSKLPGIERVQFLLEGEKQESILGHMDTSAPIEPNWALVKS